MDFAFMGDDKAPADDNPMLISYDNATDSIHSYAKTKKGDHVDCQGHRDGLGASS